MTHQPMDPIVLDQMYEHPERFTHMSKGEYIKLLIDDIRHYRSMLGLNPHGVIGENSFNDIVEGKHMDPA